MPKRINLPLNDAIISELNSGDIVMLSGALLTARDAAHKRLYTALLAGKPLPVELKNQLIFYVGPCPPTGNMPVGSCGPTTSTRCDPYTPLLLDAGLKGMLGKGKRSPEVVESIIKNRAVYFNAIGGAGAYYATCVTEAKVIAYEDLGTEAIHRFIVQDLPVIVAIDKNGKSIFNANTKL